MGEVVSNKLNDRLFINRLAQKISDMFLFDVFMQHRLNTELFDYILINEALKPQVAEMVLNCPVEALAEHGWGLEVELDRARRRIVFTIITSTARKTIVVGD